jgi:hypothetical protein
LTLDGKAHHGLSYFYRKVSDAHCGCAIRFRGSASQDATEVRMSLPFTDINCGGMPPQLPAQTAEFKSRTDTITSKMLIFLFSHLSINGPQNWEFGVTSHSKTTNILGRYSGNVLTASRFE